jgi:uncharacterized protein (TIGR02001 family)
MRNVLLLGAVAVGFAAPAFAQAAPAADPGFTVTGNIALTTDYAFRGISQTDEHPAVQGGFDATFGSFYAGTWASNVDFGFSDSIELDVYGGYKFNAGPVALDVGVIGYLYPSAADDGLSQGTGELDYYEGYVKGSFSPVTGLTIGGAGYYSPEYTGKTGKAYYVEVNGAYTFSPEFAASGAVGYQSIDDVTGVFPGKISDDYTTYNAGVTYTNWGVSLDLRYVGTSIGANDPIVKQAFTTASRSDDRVIFSIKRTM